MCLTNDIVSLTSELLPSENNVTRLSVTGTNGKSKNELSAKFGRYHVNSSRFINSFE